MKPIIQDYKTIVLVDGSFPEHPLPLSFLARAERIVCCDGAAKSLLQYGLEPDFIVGDLDSLPNDLKEKYASILFHNPDQETNDLTKAIQFCQNRGWQDLTILGATGKREDHTLGNLSLLADYAECVNVQLLTDHGVFVPQLEATEYESFVGQQVSIFSISSDTPITTRRLKYPVEDRVFTSWWQGTLNEALDTSFEIILYKGKVLIFRQYE